MAEIEKEAEGVCTPSIVMSEIREREREVFYRFPAAPIDGDVKFIPLKSPVSTLSFSMRLGAFGSGPQEVVFCRALLFSPDAAERKSFRRLRKPSAVLARSFPCLQPHHAYMKRRYPIPCMTGSVYAFKTTVCASWRARETLLGFFPNQQISKPDRNWQFTRCRAILLGKVD
jgi:hypothetical protein